MQRIDGIRKQIVVNDAPKKIISLVPSQTEFMFDLGLDNEIIGITNYCIHPQNKVVQKIKIGGTKRVDIAKIRALQPDIIFANKEENEKQDIELLSKEFLVYTSDVVTIEDAYQMMLDIGALCNKEDAAHAWVKRIQMSLQTEKQKQWGKALYLIWRKPWMSVGKDTFIHHIMQYMGFENCMQHTTRYPILSNDEIIAMQPDVILLSSEPYAFRERHIEEMQALCPNARIMLVDGEIFSWYGSRMQYISAYRDQLYANLNV